VLIACSLSGASNLARKGKTTAKISWNIVRACVTHTLWHERNERVFHPEIPAMNPVDARRITLRKVEVHWWHARKACQTNKEKGTGPHQWEYITSAILDPLIRNIRQSAGPPLHTTGEEAPRQEEIERTDDEGNDREAGREQDLCS
jgi:hypothetical protein